MCISRIALQLVAGLSIAVFGVHQAAMGGDCGHGCGSMPVPSCYARPAAAYPYQGCYCHPSGHCCGHCCHGRERRDRSRGADPADQMGSRAGSPIPIVASMPVFSAPMMFASMPVFPTTTTRSAEPYQRSTQDCHARIDRLEDNMLKLAEAMRELQTVVHDQTAALAEVTKRLDASQ